MLAADRDIRTENVREDYKTWHLVVYLEEIIIIFNKGESNRDRWSDCCIFSFMICVDWPIKFPNSGTFKTHLYYENKQEDQVFAYSLSMSH